MTQIIINVPIRIRSEANIAAHWTAKYKHRKSILKILNNYFPKEQLTPPCAVTLTRIAPRTLDYDNLVYSMKYIRDYVADKLVPNLAAGRADNTPGLSFFYDQRKGNPKEYSLELILNFTP